MPWFQIELTVAKKLLRKCERVWKRTRLPEDRLALQKAKLHVNVVIDKLKTDYYSTKVENCGSDQKKLFHVLNELLHRNKPSPLPHCESTQELAEKFSDFFTSKITRIRQDLDHENSPAAASDAPQNSTVSADCQMSTFDHATPDEILQIINSSKPSTYDLDPLPTSLLKDCNEAMAPIITNIVNKSLDTGVFPTSLKTAHVKPLLKKATLDIKEVLKNYRPVSNIPFLSKVIEKVVVTRLLGHMDRNNLHEPLQSAYNKSHSTETALLKVHNDLLQSIDRKQSVILTLLDLSAAFDTIDHALLLSRLNRDLGIDGVALAWFSSYLEARHQCVVIDGHVSGVARLNYGVPQGSVIGPIMFIIYTKPISLICKSHGISYHLYADDTQLYAAFDSSDTNDELQAKTKLEACIRDIKAWMTRNKLKLNDDKTEVVVMSSSYHRHHHSVSTLQVGETTIPTSSHVRNIGVIVDELLDMHKHIASVCKSSIFHLKNIRAVKKYVSREAVEKLIHAFVTSRLDVNNALLYGLPTTTIRPLQMILNMAAKVIVGARKFDHVTPILDALHWLPIRSRIAYKIILVTFKALHGLTPLYLTELVHKHCPSRCLRSRDAHLLSPVRTRTRAGDRSFQAAAPSLWNSLPNSIRSMNTLSTFKSALKTHLFPR